LEHADALSNGMTQLPLLGNSGYRELSVPRRTTRTARQNHICAEASLPPLYPLSDRPGGVPAANRCTVYSLTGPVIGAFVLFLYIC
jgi:hypothetical protein